MIDPEVHLSSLTYSAFMRRPTRMAKKKAQEYLRGIVEDLNTVSIHATARAIIGPTAPRILSTAESQRARLVAISTRGRGEGVSWPYGGIADRILHYARVPVLLVRPRSPLEHLRPLVRSLVVPLDGSRLADAAIPLAAELADKLGVGLRLVQAVPTPWQARSVLGWDVLEDETTADIDPVKDGQAYLDTLAGILTQGGIRTEGQVVVGAAVPSILQHAREQEGSLIVMCTAGSRGIGARWRVGSVAERVIRHSETPMLLLPPRLAPHLRSKHADVQAMPASVRVSAS